MQNETTRMPPLVILTQLEPCGPNGCADLLRNAGYDVILVEDAASAAAAASERRPALILLRLCRQASSGFESCRLLRTRPQTRAVPLIVITQMDDLYSREQMVRAGATAILVEPLRPAWLLRQLRRILARQIAAASAFDDQAAAS